MKTALIMALAALPLVATAQQQKPKTQSVKVETEHEHKGASHVHKGAVAPVERHTITRWHYHNGWKRAGEATSKKQDSQKAPVKVSPSDKGTEQK